MILDEIKNRRSVREYQTKDVDDVLINEIIKAGQFAPTAMNNRAVEFVVIRKQETKDKIFKICGQEFIKKAPVLIIPATDTSKTNCPVRDLSVASENMFLQATSLGLGTVWKNVSIPSQKEELKKLLGIPNRFKIVNIIPVGYPESESPPHTKQDFSKDKIHWNEW
ncbi:nitroreductase family protein [Candidatus Woesebacteria bacterium]|nr:nitroreductase family protein [Candidatus Woesebacteria bacterium]